MGIDLGEARIGIALSDDLGMFAHPRETIRVLPAKGRTADKTVLEQIANLARQEKVRIIVLGLPRNMDGSEGPAAAKARSFAESLRTNTGCEVAAQMILQTHLDTEALRREDPFPEAN